MSVLELEKKLIKAKTEGNLPKIVIPVHFAGQSCDMKKIHQLSQKYRFKIIEDASHAIGGRYLDQPIGRCKYSDITVFSFHPVKIITTAEGGLATTNSKKLADKMQLFRSHGVTRDTKFDAGWFYQQVSLGFNYRMTELQAALGISQMQRLDEFVAKRHFFKERYDFLLSGLPLIRPYQEEYNYSALHLYPILLDLDQIDKNRKQVYDELRQNRIGVNVHYIPIHTQPHYKQFGFIEEDFPVSVSYYNRAISIPLFSSMTENQQDETSKALERVLK
jgi:dTDP-4-amino-4,6-dideoxygalactose transaminase